MVVPHNLPQIGTVLNLDLDPLDEHSLVWRHGYEEGVRRALKECDTTKSLMTEGDPGVDISKVNLLRYALQDLPSGTEVLDAYGLPLRGEVADNYSFGKSLFVYGRRYRPRTLGEPF